MAHLDDIERTWEAALPPPQATERVSDLLRAYGWRVTLQDDDFVAAEGPGRRLRRFAPIGAVLLAAAALSRTHPWRRRALQLLDRDRRPVATA